MIHPNLAANESGFFPASPDCLEKLGATAEVASNLALKIAATTASFDSHWMIDRLKLSHGIVDAILWRLKDDKLLEMLGQTGLLTYQYRITQRGLELSRRLMELCGYVGPTPVSLDEYRSSVLAQYRANQRVTIEDVERATAELTIDPEILEIATLALASSRSLFLFGPPGNGKSSLGRLLHNAVHNTIWVPHAIAVDSQVIEFFDPQNHRNVEFDENQNFDKRWHHVEQPFVMTGGELTMSQLDLVFDRSFNFYEAPPHLKANCGTFFIDDLGRQRILPSDLLNRWIVPLEQQIDYLTLVNGTKIEVPFRIMLTVATNLTTTEVADPAFLRRMGYRIHLDNPSKAAIKTIFEKQARSQHLQLADGLVEAVIHRYQHEGRQWRASEPRDLLVRCQDVIALRNAPPIVNENILNVAWRGYFSSGLTDQSFAVD